MTPFLLAIGSQGLLLPVPALVSVPQPVPQLPPAVQTFWESVMHAQVRSLTALSGDPALLRQLDSTPRGNSGGFWP